MTKTIEFMGDTLKGKLGVGLAVVDSPIASHYCSYSPFVEAKQLSIPRQVFPISYCETMPRTEEVFQDPAFWEKLKSGCKKDFMWGLYSVVAYEQPSDWQFPWYVVVNGFRCKCQSE